MTHIQEYFVFKKKQAKNIYLNNYLQTGFMIEAIVFFCTVLTASLGYVTFYKTYIGSVKESLQFLKDRYRFAKELNETVKKRIMDYAENNQCYDGIFMQGITFR